MALLTSPTNLLRNGLNFTKTSWGKIYRSPLIQNNLPATMLGAANNALIGSSRGLNSHKIEGLETLLARTPLMPITYAEAAPLAVEEELVAVIEEELTPAGEKIERFESLSDEDITPLTEGIEGNQGLSLLSDTTIGIKIVGPPTEGTSAFNLLRIIYSSPYQAAAVHNRTIMTFLRGAAFNRSYHKLDENSFAHRLVGYTVAPDVLPENPPIIATG